MPDFSGAGPRVSTPVVYRARTARDVRQISSDAAAALPTSMREFSRTERIVVRFVFTGPGGTAPALTLKLLNGTGDPMTTLVAPTPDADGFYQIELPLAGLAAGNYLLDIEAAAASGSTRSLVGFAVTA